MQLQCISKQNKGPLFEEALVCLRFNFLSSIDIS